MFWLVRCIDESVLETLRHTLNVLATVVPEWLSEITPADWFDVTAAELKRLITSS